MYILATRSKTKLRPIVHAQARNIIRNVVKFFDEQKSNGVLCYPLQQATNLAAAATGMSMSFIKKIRKEMEVNSNAPLSSPKKKRTTPAQRKVIMDEMNFSILRNTVRDTYTIEHKVPTLQSLLIKMQEKINYNGSIETLRKHLHQIGYSFKKCVDKRKCLMERNDIVAWRSRYLRTIKENENLPNPKPVTYLDETYIHPSYGVSKCWQSAEDPGVYKQNRTGQRFIIVHAGGEYGFVQNALLIFKSKSMSGDYHDDMNHNNFMHWLSNKLIPNLPPNGIVVMDNASYHSVQINKAPTQSNKKCDIISWLQSNNVPVTADMRKAELLHLVKMQNHTKTYYVDELLKQHGHVVVRLPPYHCELNPIEEVWSLMKHKVAVRNVEQKITNTLKFVEESFAEINQLQWNNYCAHVKKVQEDYWKKDGLIDEVFEEIIIVVNENSSDEDESDWFDTDGNE